MAETVIQLVTKELIICIPFTGPERKCWDCGGKRELMLTYDLKDGQLKEYKDVCNIAVGAKKNASL